MSATEPAEKSESVPTHAGGGRPSLASSLNHRTTKQVPRHPQLDSLTRELTPAPPQSASEPIDYRTRGTQIDDGAHQQMRNACQIPAAVGAALMPDADIDYGLPIGGVLAAQDIVIPYAVGVDIAWCMKISIPCIPLESPENRFEHYRNALENGTRFGVGSVHKKPQDHA